MHEWIAKDPHAAKSLGLPTDTPVLYCFHHAGGSAASFNAWRLRWNAGSRLRFVELPGRPGDSQALQCSDVNELVQQLLEGFLPQLHEGVPFAFYGHSLGALVAYRLARALVDQAHAPPSFLAVSGRRAPTLPLPSSPLWNLPDDALVDSLRTLGGLSESLLASAKWRRLFIPCMRADLRLSDEYLEIHDSPLALPVIALRGEQDPIVSPRELDEWRSVSSGAFEVSALPGTHFFTPEGTLRLQRRLHDAMARIAGGTCVRPRQGKQVCVS